MTFWGCEEQHQSIREGTRRGAKNTKGYWDFPCLNARVSRPLLPFIAALTNVNEH